MLIFLDSLIEYLCKNAATIATLASAAFAGASAIIAASAIYFSHRTNKSQLILNQAMQSLEHAYNTLTADGKHLTPPLPDRLGWLTAARHLTRYESLKISISDATHKIICDEQEEFWRHKFYLCLQSPDLQQPSYYSKKPPLDAGIEPTSALVIHAFAKWPDNRSDPLDSVNIGDLMSIKNALQGNYGLQIHLKNFERFRSKIPAQS